MMTEGTQAVYDRYHRIYDNDTYQAIAELFARDLHAEREGEAVADAMNIVTDAAFALCGDEHRADAPQQLAVFCGQNSVSNETVDALFRYLSRFEPPWQIHAVDFEATAKALIIAYPAREQLWCSAAHANGIHSWRGRAAYELLSAADLLVQAAIQLLQHGDDSYIREKLRAGVSRITSALYEGIRNSSAPHQYDLNSTYFPRISDRR